MKTIQTKQATLEFRKDGITRLRYGNDIMDLENAIELIKTLKDNSPWQASPVLVSAEAFGGNDGEARKFIASSEVMQNFTAVAVLFNSSAQKMMVNFFIRFTKPTVPLKLFSKEEEAVKWLKGFDAIPKK